VIRSKVQVVNNFAKVTAAVDKLALESVAAAADAALPVAEAGSSIDLKLEVVPAQGDIDGYSAGIRSRKTTSNPGETTKVALFFDQGTLGKRKKQLKQPGRREESWHVKRGNSSYTAHRSDVEGKGIAPEGFFGKARSAGRTALVRTLSRGG
jgi:hypothetical protein